MTDRSTLAIDGGKSGRRFNGLVTPGGEREQAEKALHQNDIVSTGA